MYQNLLVDVHNPAHKASIIGTAARRIDTQTHTTAGCIDASHTDVLDNKKCIIIIILE